MLVSITTTGSVFIWAYIISQNWDVYAPGFRSLSQNVEYIESETEFDINPPDTNADDTTREDPATVCSHIHVLEPFQGMSRQDCWHSCIHASGHRNTSSFGIDIASCGDVILYSRCRAFLSTTGVDVDTI
jgi:hypothetical protein